MKLIDYFLILATIIMALTFFKAGYDEGHQNGWLKAMENCECTRARCMKYMVDYK